MKNFSIYQLKAKDAKSIGFKTKKQLVQFAKGNEFSLLRYKNKESFLKFFKTKLEQFNFINAIVNDEENRKQRREKNFKTFKKLEKKINQKIYYTATVLLCVKIDPDAKGFFKKFYDESGNTYVAIHRLLRNVSDKNIYSFATGNGRTYKSNPRFRTLVNILNHMYETDLTDIPSADVSLIIVKNITEVKSNRKLKYEPADELVWNDNLEHGIYHKYIDYKVNKNANSFNELFELESCEYVKENKKPNSCFLNILVDTYHDTFKRSNYSFDATYEEFLDLLELDNKDHSIGLSVNKSLSFFKKYNLGLCVIGRYGIIEMYKPEKRNTYISPNSLYVLVSNQHCYKLNSDINSLSKKIWKSDTMLQNDITRTLCYNIPDTYYVHTPDSEYNVMYCSSLDDITEDIKKTDDQESVRKTYIQSDNNLEDILKIMVFDNNIIPDVTVINNKITEVIFKVGNISSIVKQCSSIDAEQKDLIIPKDNYSKYHCARNKLYDSIFKDEYMSTYNERNKEIETMYEFAPMCCKFDEDYDDDEYNGLDTRKAYTSDFMDIEYFPVFDYFDVWNEYDNHEIEDYTQYLVKCFSKSVHNTILFNGNVSRVYGYKLNRIDMKPKIIAYKRPSKLQQVDTKQMIKDLWDTDISGDNNIDSTFKKDIFNIISGLIGKKKNKRSCSKIFKDIDEATYYQSKFGGNILGVGDDDNKMYILTNQGEKDLINGFVPIKELIYDIRSLKTYHDYMKLLKNKILPVAIKTDCLFFEKKNTKYVEKLFDMSNDIGKYKIEYDKILPSTLIYKKTLDEPNICLEVNEHYVKNERDKNEVNNLITNKNKILFKGLLPGVGKTTTAINYDKKKLFVCPFNKLCLELRKKGLDSVTLNMFLGIDFRGLESKRKVHDVSDYECIVFDEIFLYTPNNLMKIKKFMDNNTDKIFIATGDDKQNVPIGMENMSDTIDTTKYLNDCVNMLFKDHLILKECKRLKNKEDIGRIVQLKNDIFNKKKDIMTTIKTHGIKVINNMKDLKTTSNICFFNYRCNEVNTYIHDKIVKPSKGYIVNDIYLYKGLELVCKEHKKNSAFRLFKNYIYIIKSINEKEIILHEPVEDVTIKSDIKILDCFKLPYANTNHSVQGCTITDSYTIFDINTPYVNRNWIWTSLTRTDDLSKIIVFEHSLQEIRKKQFSKIEQYVNNKVKNYKSQDKKANREIDNNLYITSEWIRRTKIEQNHECAICQCALEFDINDAKVTSNLTVDRINNTLSHYKKNCKLTCIRCNCSRK